MLNRRLQELSTLSSSPFMKQLFLLALESVFQSLKNNPGDVIWDFPKY